MADTFTTKIWRQQNSLHVILTTTSINSKILPAIKIMKANLQADRSASLSNIDV